MSTLIQPMETVRRRIATLRAARGWTREELIDRIQQAGVQMTVAQLGFIEIGRRKTISVDELFLFASVFGVPIEDLCQEPQCANCHDAPPPGYLCIVCKRPA